MCSEECTNQKSSGIVGGMETISTKMESLGPMTGTEKLTLVILLFTIGLWVTTGITGLNSYSVALIGAVLFFIFRVLEWKDAQTGVDWGLIIFFGGALSPWSSTTKHRSSKLAHNRYSRLTRS